MAKTMSFSQKRRQSTRHDLWALGQHEDSMILSPSLPTQDSYSSRKLQIKCKEGG